MASHHFATADVETELIAAGTRTIAEVRDEVEAREGVRIPITWFVRFQRTWKASVNNSAVEAFEEPLTDCFDGFSLARRELLALRDRGDEIGWHYHAYNYVHRDDLSHATKLDILRTDMASCARELRRRHPEFSVGSFRFGWFFVPDYAIYDDFESLGITRDASINPSHGDDPVAAEFSVRFLRPLATAPTRLDSVTLFPKANTSLIHDWSVVDHDLGWSQRDEDAAAAERRRLASELTSTAADLKRDGGEFLTYETAPTSLFDDPARV